MVSALDHAPYGSQPGRVGPRRDLLLIAADWQSRALTLAELQEAGYEVMAVPGVEYALRALRRGLVAPPLIVLDVHDDPAATPERVARLMELASGVPLVLIVGVYDRAMWEPLKPRVVAWIERPVTIGRIVDTVRSFAEPSSQQ